MGKTRFDPETARLLEDQGREKNWKRWGPYLSERQWGTVREDYSEWGNCWDYFPHDHARSRAYRWGEDGLLGFTDRECRLCFALALWNEKDPILKERLFGLTGPEGNHGEDVKEYYYYLDSTPTHSYFKGLYKYPQREYPYSILSSEARKRGLNDRELELTDLGSFDEGRYFDVFAEYAKASPDDILIRITISNRGPDLAPVHVLPTLWARNTWIWGCTHEGCWLRPRMKMDTERTVIVHHQTLPQMTFEAGVDPLTGMPPRLLFTENESNTRRLWGYDNYTPYVKDAFHRLIIDKAHDAVNPASIGSKVAPHYRLEIPPGESVSLKLRFYDSALHEGRAIDAHFDRIFDLRIEEANQFYEEHIPDDVRGDANSVMRQAYAGLLWSKQFYHYVVKDWLDGDPHMPPPPASRKSGRNKEWRHLFNRDVLSMPDKWEYPWFAAWDLAFHMLPMCRIDPTFAKDQLLLLLREWYMHPNGQIPAYEFAFGDVNPPVHAWACWRVYKMTGKKGQRDVKFLARAFQKLMLNFTWWVNRKDDDGDNVFGGGFLGLDNIGVFDRSRPLPTGGALNQADGTAWMAFYCSTMLSIALELASEDPVYEDVASKFFEHFVAIADAMNSLGGTGLWHEEDGFYYDQLQVGGHVTPLCVRSLVGVVPLFAGEVLEQELIDRLPGFRKRMNWFLEHREDLESSISYLEIDPQQPDRQRTLRLLAIPSRERLERVLRYLFDEDEFLSPYGIRSLSKAHAKKPYSFWVDGYEHRVDYVPGESNTYLFGGNSNWRGPIWFPLNHLLIEALERYHYYYGERLKVELPARSGRWVTLGEAANELRHRLSRLFLADPQGRRPCHGLDRRYAHDPHWKNLVLFHEYFHADNGEGLGATHQTGWTALVTECLLKGGVE